MSQVEAFLTKAEEDEIVEAIRQAEKNTSGEIRVHIEPHSKIDHFSRAQQVFVQLKMEATQDRNGVLIYVAVEDHKFVIYGDQGIDRVVPEGFWDSTKDLIQQHFLQGRFKDGIVAGVLKAGEELKKHFPWEADDINELSDEVSKG